MKKAVIFIWEGVAGKAICEDYCKERGYAVVDTVTGVPDQVEQLVYSDYVRKMKADVLVCLTYGNSVYDYYRLKYHMLMHGCDIECPGTDFATTMSLMEKFIHDLAEAEKEATSGRRFSYQRERKIATGGYVGGNAPMGYRVKDGKLEINHAEVPVVLLIMQRKHEGRTMVSTLDALNQNDCYRSRSGKPFALSTVSSIWRNEQFYRGYYLNKETGEWVKGQHEAILEG